jgi:hypothetical protein
MLKKILIGVGAFLALVVIIIGVAIFLATRPIENQSTIIAPVSQQQDNSTKYDTLIGIKKEVEAAQQSEKSKTITFVITDDQANSNMAKLVNSQPIAGMTLKDAHMYFREGFVESVIKAEIRGIPMDIVMKYTIEITNGEPIVTVQSVNAGILPVPFSKEQLSKSLSNAMAKILKDNGLNPYNPTIQITTGKMIVTGATK